ncbi:MAG: hypothetical protein HYZ00_09645 [Candidatus Hydrogenedentes bacterium]|nr:hypothetical protein [Candidatus Hydrogenedentota bacterium]
MGLEFGVGGIEGFLEAVGFAAAEEGDFFGGEFGDEEGDRGFFAGGEGGLAVDFGVRG